jgi:hypothetical protein
MRQIGGTAYFVEQAKGCPNLKFDIDRIPEFTEEELLDALRLVEAEWNRFLVRQRAFDQKRIRQKMRGIRQPRRADVDRLYNWESKTDMEPSTQKDDQAREEFQ